MKSVKKISVKMKKIVAAFVIATVSIIACYSQTYEEQACSTSLQEFNAALIRKHVDAEKFADHTKRLLALQSSVPDETIINEYEAVKDTIVNLLTKAGLFPNGHLDVEELLECISDFYDYKDSKADTTSALYGLFMLMVDYEEYDSMISELSPSLQIRALQTVIPREKLSEDFFRTFYVVMFSGIIHEFDVAVAKRHLESEEKVEKDTTQSYDVLEIVPDDVMIVPDDVMVVPDDVSR